MEQIALSSLDPKRVLIIKPSAIGDIVHALPVLPLLRRRWPEAKVTWMVTPQCADLVRDHPLVDDILLFERRRLGRMLTHPSGLIEAASFFRTLRRREFDLAIDLQGLFRSALLAGCTAAPVRIGFSNARELAPLFYTHWVDCSWKSDHAVRRYLKIMETLGCDDGPVEFVFAVGDADREFIAGLVPPEVKYAVLLPGAIWATKRWPVQRFAEVAKQVRERFGLESVVSGSREDTPLARQIPARFDLTGKTTLRQTVALIERADLVIANDTGPMHIAAALDRPLVTPYGPTSAIRTGPFDRPQSVVSIDLPCAPCLSRYCSHMSCMSWLTAKDILRVASDQLSVTTCK